jgi:hypothetical protein
MTRRKTFDAFEIHQMAPECVADLAYFTNTGVKKKYVRLPCVRYDGRVRLTVSQLRRAPKSDMRVF